MKRECIETKRLITIFSLKSSSVYVLSFMATFEWIRKSLEQNFRLNLCLNFHRCPKVEMLLGVMFIKPMVVMMVLSLTYIFLLTINRNNVGSGYEVSVRVLSVSLAAYTTIFWIFIASLKKKMERNNELRLAFVPDLSKKPRNARLGSNIS